MGGTNLVAAQASAWLARSWSSDDELPNNTVGGLAQTADGYLWLGTPNGLARFDGVRFENISITNIIASPNRGILTMTSGRGGGLHLGMDRGAVVSLNDGQQQVFIADSELSTLTIHSLTEDAQGVVWIGYRGGSVSRIENGQVTRFVSENGLPEGTMICSLVCDPKGQLWFIKNGQLGVWRDGKFETLQRLKSLPARLAVARTGGVWICSGFGLYKFKEGGEVEDRGVFKPRFPGAEPSVLMESRDGAVWIGTTLSGLFRYDGTTFESIPTTHQEILSLFEDAEGNIWVGTGGGGLNQVRPRAITLETGEAGLSFEAVQSLSEDTNGQVWAAMQNGALARQVEGRWQALPPEANWTNIAMSVCADPSGDVWVGTRYNRMSRWQRDCFVDWGDLRQFKGQTVHTLVVATNGDLWIGEDSPTAVQRLRNGQLQNFELPNDIRVIRASAVDAAGNIWFGTSKGVLLRVAGERIVDETARTTGEPQPIRYLYATPDGSLWIGYAGWGVGRIKNGKFAMISARQGLYDDFVSQIVADDRGWLWFGANRGIFKVRHKELEDVAEGRTTRVRSVHYGPGDYGQGEGRPSLQANFGNSPIALRSRDGRLWFSMRTALAVVDPGKLREDSKAPAVLLNRVKVGERVMAAYGGMVAPQKNEHGEAVLELASVQEGLRVPPDHRRMEFEFTALSFVGAENISFRYRLEGVDEDWVAAGAQRNERNAIYPRLPPGDYRFQVNACNSEGIWNETGAALAFVVAPFFWQTWWFRTAVITAFTGIVIAIVRYVSFRRLRSQLATLEQQAALHKERARIAKDIHDDLGANLTQISLVGELAHQDRETPEKVTAHLDKISGTARQAIKSLDEIVWAVNPRNDTLAHFIDYTGQFALDYLRVAGLRCRLDLPEQVLARELSTDLRHNLFLVVKEAINNTVKHAHATELRLQISVTNEKLAIVVEDNGRGFSQETVEVGADGLRNMRQRLADIGGTCWIQGRPGAGVKVALEISWEQIKG